VNRAGVTVALLVAGGVVLAASAGVWLSAEVPTVTTTAPVSLTGASAAPATTAAGLVILAGALAMTIAGVAVGRISAAVVAATGAGALAQCVQLLRDPAAALEPAAVDVTGVPAVAGEISVHPVAWVAVAGLVVATLVALYAVRAAGSWPRDRSRFERAPQAVAIDPRTRAMDDWDALGRGEDPSGIDGTLDPKEDR